MGLIDLFRRRCDVWSWRLRYWFLDTRAGRQAQLALFALGITFVVVELVRMAVRAAIAPPSDEPQQAYWWVVQLILVIVAAVVSYATRPKPQKAAPATGTSPTTQDGQAVRDVFGTVWIDDEFLLAWKVMGTTPIKTKGGKK